jgi:S-adenosylmethionine hydrolase
VGSARGLIAVQAHGQYFLAPDNGLLSQVAAGAGASTRRISAETLHAIGASAAGPTFHGRDLLAPLAAELATGRLPFASLGPPCQPLQCQVLPAPEAVSGGWQGWVAAVDRFGNLITNVEGSRLPQGLDWHAEIAGQRARAVAAYAAGTQGELITLVNAWGLVEVAVSCANAAECLGVGRGARVRVARNGSG